jgi:hypothetical protein
MQLPDYSCNQPPAIAPSIRIDHSLQRFQPYFIGLNVVIVCVIATLLFWGNYTEDPRLKQQLA